MIITPSIEKDHFYVKGYKFSINEPVTDVNMVAQIFKHCTTLVDRAEKMGVETRWRKLVPRVGVFSEIIVLVIDFEVLTAAYDENGLLRYEIPVIDEETWTYKPNLYVEYWENTDEHGFSFRPVVRLDVPQLCITLDPKTGAILKDGGATLGW